MPDKLVPPPMRIIGATTDPVAPLNSCPTIHTYPVEPGADQMSYVPFVVQSTPRSSPDMSWFEFEKPVKPYTIIEDLDAFVKELRVVSVQLKAFKDYESRLSNLESAINHLSRRMSKLEDTHEPTF